MRNWNSSDKFQNIDPIHAFKTTDLNPFFSLFFFISVYFHGKSGLADIDQVSCVGIILCQKEIQNYGRYLLRLGYFLMSNRLAKEYISKQCSEKIDHAVTQQSHAFLPGSCYRSIDAKCVEQIKVQKCHFI